MDYLWIGWRPEQCLLYYLKLLTQHWISSSLNYFSKCCKICWIISKGEAKMLQILLTNFYKIMNNRYFLFTLLIVIFSFFLFISFEFFVVFSFLFLVLFVRLLFVPLKSGTRGINWRWIICHYRARNGIEVYDISTVRTICTLPPLIYQIYVSSNVKLLQLKTWLEKIARVIKIIYKI